MSDVVEQLRKIVAEKLDVNLTYEEVDPEVTLFEEGLGMDSIAVMEFITQIENHFGFKFAEEELDMELFQNVNMVADMVGKKLA